MTSSVAPAAKSTTHSTQAVGDAHQDGAPATVDDRHVAETVKTLAAGAAGNAGSTRVAGSSGPAAGANDHASPTQSPPRSGSNEGPIRSAAPSNDTRPGAQASEPASPAFERDDDMETMSALSRHMDKVPDGFKFSDLDAMSKDTSLPKDLREAYAALRDDPELQAKLDSADSANGLSGSRKSENDGNVRHSDLRDAFNNPEFVAYNREKSKAYTECYIPSDAAEGKAKPRAMTESDAARELYLYSDSLPDNIDRKSLQHIVDGQCNGKCPAQLKAAAQFLLDHRKSLDKLMPGGSVGRGDLENNAAPLIHLNADEVDAIEYLKSDPDRFMQSGHGLRHRHDKFITRDSLTAVANDESAPAEARRAAQTLLDSPVAFGMLDNAHAGHAANGANDGQIAQDDIDALKLSAANRQPPPEGPSPARGGSARGDAPSGDAGIPRELMELVTGEMLLGMQDDPEIKEERGGKNRKARVLHGLAKTLDWVKTGLDTVAGFLPPPFGAAVAGLSAGIAAVNEFGVKASMARANGMSRTDARKQAAKNFAFDAATSAVSMVPGGGLAAKGLMQGGRQVATVAGRAAGGLVMREGMEAGARKGIETGVREGAEGVGRRGVEAGMREGAESGGREGLEAGARRGAKKSVEEGAEQGVEESAEATLKEQVKEAAIDMAREEAMTQGQAFVSQRTGVDLSGGQGDASSAGFGSGGRRGRGVDLSHHGHGPDRPTRSNADVPRGRGAEDHPSSRSANPDAARKGDSKADRDADRRAQRKEEAAAREQQTSETDAASQEQDFAALQLMQLLMMGSVVSQLPHITAVAPDVDSRQSLSSKADA